MNTPIAAASTKYKVNDSIKVEEAIASSRDQQQSLQLTGISKPTPNDVLCGRGGGSQNHIGNKEYRAVIAANKRQYIGLPRKLKSLLVESIVNAVRLQSPPGRFLEKDNKGLWADIGDKRAFAKTCQAIREGAPKIREEMVNPTTVTSTRDIPMTPVSSLFAPNNLGAVAVPELYASAEEVKLSISSIEPQVPHVLVDQTPIEHSKSTNFDITQPESLLSNDVANALSNIAHQGPSIKTGNVVTPLNLSGHDLYDENDDVIDDIFDSSLLFPAIVLNESELMSMPIADFAESYLDTVMHGSDSIEGDEFFHSKTDHGLFPDDAIEIDRILSSSVHSDLVGFLNECNRFSEDNTENFLGSDIAMICDRIESSSEMS